MEFLSDPLTNITLDSWFKHFKDLHYFGFVNQDDALKVKPLLYKLDTVKHEKYRNFIMEYQQYDRKFKGTVKELSQMFADQSLLFNTRY